VVPRDNAPSPTSSAGRTGLLTSIPRTAGAEPGSAAVHLDWAGREEAARLAGSPPRGNLRKVPELSTGEGRSGNAIIHADNLPAMAALIPAFRGQAVLEQNTSDGGHRKFVLIETADYAQNLIPRLLAEAPCGGSRRSSRLRLLYPHGGARGACGRLRIRRLAAGLILALFLASLNQTVVGTRC
jgi:hypothetical protein